MIKKHIICPEQLRRIPEHFSWIDHRLIRDDYVCRCQTEELALYLFLVTVGDAEGLSFYSDSSLCKQLSIDLITLRQARQALIHIGLIAYEKPLYQVLDLGRKSLIWEAISPAKDEKPKDSDDSSPRNQKPSPCHPQVRTETSLQIGEIITQMKRRLET
jgi:hypothetical protein